MILEILNKAIQELDSAGCESPRLDAEVLLAFALGCERHELYEIAGKLEREKWLLQKDAAVAGASSVATPSVLHINAVGARRPRSLSAILSLYPGCKNRLPQLFLESISPAQACHQFLNTFQSYIERRKKKEPVAYIRGFKEFWSLNIKVTRDVLIPRPETEEIIEKAIKLFPSKNQPLDILDLCTGSGCIAAALAKEYPKADITVTDISEGALSVAKENLAFAAGRITFLQSDFFEKVKGVFDLIVSNPPYIKSSDYENLIPEICNYEPRLALDGGIDGLEIIRKIRENYRRYLKREGKLVLENGPRIEEA